MASFKDTKGRIWSPRITLLVLSKLESSLGMKFLGGADSEKIKDTVFGSIDNFLTALWYSIESEAVTRAVDRAELGESLDGAATIAATDAFGQAMRDFWPQAGEAGLRPTEGTEMNGTGPKSSP